MTSPPVTRITAAEYQAGMLTKKRHKYGAKRATLDGYKFDSQAERDRYAVLRQMEVARQISDLQVHPRFPLVVNGRRCGLYEADFAYLEPRAMKRPNVIDMGGDPMPHIPGVTTVRVIEDVKGVATAEYKIKRELFLALYPDAEFREMNIGKPSKRAAWAAAVKRRGT